MHLNFNKVTNLICWGLLSSVILIWFFISVAGDYWWPATLLLFGPRWLILLPLLVLLPFAAWKNRRMILPLVVALLIIIGPVMGFTVTVNKPRSANAHYFRIITCNIQNGTFDLPALNALIKNRQPDIVALQECPRGIKLSLPVGWQIIQDGELAVMSRYSLRTGKSLHSMHPPHKWPRTSLLSCVVSVPGGDVAFCNVHLPSPRYGLQNVLDRKTIINFTRSDLLDHETEHRLKTAEEVQRSIRKLNMPVIIAGDFNTPVESAIYRQVWKGYDNAFSKTGTGFGWTEHASFRGVPMAVRIDHILTGDDLVPQFCEVGPDIGSDHLPVIADVARSVL